MTLKMWQNAQKMGSEFQSFEPATEKAQKQCPGVKHNKSQELYVYKEENDNNERPGVIGKTTYISA